MAAAVEYGDRVQRRPVLKWQREIELRIPVHDPDRWNDQRVADTLHDVLEFLTGDQWQITFYKRSQPLNPPRQGQFNLKDGINAVIPFSDGMDSRAVAGLMAREMGDKLIRVRLGSKTRDAQSPSPQKHPFTSVPYRIRPGDQQFVELSARSRGFKFALISGLAAYLSKAGQVIVPESSPRSPWPDAGARRPSLRG